MQYIWHGCSKLQSTNETRNEPAAHVQPYQDKRLHPLPPQAKKDGSFTILQFNANGIGNKVMELDDFLKQHNVKVAVKKWKSKLTGT